ncbi:hypothetical protein C0J52_05051 [Blattella germanica]|nr:hypothetical protein C0J52_05051 [Blattella germanica]
MLSTLHSPVFHIAAWGHPRFCQAFHVTGILARSDMSVLSRNASENLVWIDLEMTGLDVEKDQILEIACLVTDATLNSVVEGPDVIIHQPDSVLASMNDWCLEHHAKSGLTEASRKSKTSLLEAEQKVINFLKEHVPRGGGTQSCLRRPQGKPFATEHSVTSKKVCRNSSTTNLRL